MAYVIHFSFLALQVVNESRTAFTFLEVLFIEPTAKKILKIIMQTVKYSNLYVNVRY